MFIFCKSFLGLQYTYWIPSCNNDGAQFYLQVLLGGYCVVPWPAALIWIRISIILYVYLQADSPNFTFLWIILRRYNTTVMRRPRVKLEAWRFNCPILVSDIPHLARKVFDPTSWGIFMASYHNLIWTFDHLNSHPGLKNPIVTLFCFDSYFYIRTYGSSASRNVPRRILVPRSSCSSLQEYKRRGTSWAPEVPEAHILLSCTQSRLLRSLWWLWYLSAAWVLV